MNYLTAFLGGALMGAVTGILFAPQSGAKTRARMKETGETLREGYRTLREKGEELSRTGKAKFSIVPGKDEGAGKQIEENEPTQAWVYDM